MGDPSQTIHEMPSTMRYDTVEIKPSTDGDWQVFHRKLPYDRKEGEQHLNSVFGFFHYPRKWGKKKAFEVLRNQMIHDRLKAIIELQNQIEHLRALTAPD